MKRMHLKVDLVIAKLPRYLVSNLASPSSMTKPTLTSQQKVWLQRVDIFKGSASFYSLHAESVCRQKMCTIDNILFSLVAWFHTRENGTIHLLWTVNYHTLISYLLKKLLKVQMHSSQLELSGGNT